MQDLCDALVTSIHSFPHSYQVVVGDWQQPVMGTPLGQMLSNQGWVSHEALLGPVPGSLSDGPQIESDAWSHSLERW